jgi:hypothetical protein
MSDLQTSMGDDILQMPVIVYTSPLCVTASLSEEAVEQLFKGDVS